MKDFYEQLRDQGHVLEETDTGKVKYCDLGGNRHGGPHCIECDNYWCEHCPDSIDKCEGSAPRLAREGEEAEKQARVAMLLVAWNDPELLRKRLASLERAP